MSRTPLAEAILRVLRKAKAPQMAKEILRDLRTAGQDAGSSKAEINTALYGELEPAGLVIRQPEYRWTTAVTTTITDQPAVTARRSAQYHLAPSANTKVAAAASQALPGPPPVVTTWNDDQKLVIDAPPTESLLVDAGPGTGKTAVACARVANLITTFSISPATILLVSFTRTAVAEIRSRLAVYLGDERKAAAVRIATLDSEAWRIYHGFVANESHFAGGYDANIERSISLLREGGDELDDYLSRFRHLIVDEAQDLTGTRATLILAVLSRVPRSCGVTVFADPGQAIYGFTIEEGHRAKSDQDFLGQLARVANRTVREVVFTQIHRTDAPQLQSIFTESRPFLTRSDSSGNAEIRNVLRQRAEGMPPALCDVGPGHLMLHRYRRDVLRRSQELCQAGVPHRLRMASTPVVVHPWIGWLLGHQSGSYLDRKVFDSLWESREMSLLFPAEERDRGFKLLWSLGPADGNRIDLAQLRTQFSRSRPPMEACATECGMAGPVLGTIHASKGREADEVVLALPPIPKPDDDVAEETRVLYVGATRPRKKLVVHDDQASNAYPLKSGRLWCLQPPKPAAKYLLATVEYGMDGDIDLTAALRAEISATLEDADIAQRLLAESATGLRKVNGHCRADWQYDGIRLELAERPGIWIGQFTKRVQTDLNEIRMWFRESFSTKVITPTRIEGLHLFGAQTITLSEGDPQRDLLHDPYRASGFMLAPVVISYPVTFFRKV